MIRKANLNDIEDINKLGELLHPNFSYLYPLKEELNKDLTILFVNVEEEKINGYLYAQDFGDYIDLLSIVVKPRYRRLKIGTNLIQYLIDNYCYQDKAIFLEVATDNESAYQLYQKMNFKVVNIRKNYYNNKDAFLMKRG